MSEEEKQRRAAEHFSLYALDGKASGAILWQHVARVDREEVSAASTFPALLPPIFEDACGLTVRAHC